MSSMVLMETVALPLVAGLVLGTVYFGGLWYTLRRLTGSRRPALLFLGSYFGRGAVCFSGLYLVARSGGWESLLICLTGLMLVRFFLVHRWGNGRFTAFRKGFDTTARPTPLGVGEPSSRGERKWK